MQYIVIDEPSPSFSEKVNAMLDAGWMLQGGVAVVSCSPGKESTNVFGPDSPQEYFGGVRLFQAMTHERDDADIPVGCAGSFYG